MPIKPENRDRYPKDWAKIRYGILQRARQACEQCGVENYALGGRDSARRWHYALPLGEKLLRLEWPQPGTWAWCRRDTDPPQKLRIIRIVLTIAHLDHVPENCDEANLRALCQRCHLMHDRRHHAEQRTITRRAGRAIRDLLE